MTSRASTEMVAHIAALVCDARPDWPEHLVTVVLLSHADQVDGTDLAIAAIRCARNPDYPTPRSIGWRGPHWADLETRPVQLRKPERCYTCGKAEPDCYSNRYGGDDHRFETIEQAEAAAVRQVGPRVVAT